MLNDRCAPGGGGGNGAARWIIWMAARSNSAEPELRRIDRSEEHTSELQSQSTISYAVFCLKKKKKKKKRRIKKKEKKKERDTTRQIAMKVHNTEK